MKERNQILRWRANIICDLMANGLPDSFDRYHDWNDPALGGLGMEILSLHSVRFWKRRLGRGLWDDGCYIDFLDVRPFGCRKYTWGNPEMLATPSGALS